MSIFEVFLIFMVISSLQPVIRQRWLEARRLSLLRELEEKRESRAIGMIHRQETLSFLGIPIFRYIDIQDSEAILRAIQLTDKSVPIDLILHTPGGMVLASDQIAHALRKHPAKVTVFVPHYAMSGGTLIALAADEVAMSDNAVLGPVDPQLGQSPAVSILNVVERKPIAEIDDQTLILSDVAEKAVCQVDRTVRRLIQGRMDEEQADRLARTLVRGTWTHDYPISVDEARDLGMPVSTAVPVEVFNLMQLYPQTAQQRPGVEYIPMPYGPNERRSVHPDRSKSNSVTQPPGTTER